MPAPSTTVRLALSVVLTLALGIVAVAVVDSVFHPPPRCPHAPDPLGERRRPAHVLADLEDTVG